MKETVKNISGELKIRDFLKRHMGLSTSLIAKVKYGGVFLNGVTVHMRAPVKNGDVIEIVYPEEDSENIQPIDLPIEILYEDEDILAVDKPTNMPVHPSRGNHLPTVANAVRAYLNRPFVFRAVNRLDRDTSGIVLIAKNQLASAKLCQSMKDNRFKKTYLGRVVGTPAPMQNTISAPIERICEGSIKRGVLQGGKCAITEYQVLETDGVTSVCKITPITGRTHQIRVHMAYIGHPLYADFLYGERVEGETYSLHCSELTFPHPKTDEIITVKSKRSI